MYHIVWFQQLFLPNLSRSCKQTHSYGNRQFLPTVRHTNFNCIFCFIIDFYSNNECSDTFYTPALGSQENRARQKAPNEILRHGLALKILISTLLVNGVINSNELTLFLPNIKNTFLVIQSSRYINCDTSGINYKSQNQWQTTDFCGAFMKYVRTQCICQLLAQLIFFQEEKKNIEESK